MKSDSFLLVITCILLMNRPLGIQAQNCNVNGGTISTNSPTVFCSGDGIADIVNFNVSGSSGTHSRMLLTDAFSNIVEIHNSLEIDFEGRPSRTFIARHISFEDGLVGLTVGNNIDNLSGCFSLSTNSMTVTTFAFDGGTLTTQNGRTDTNICVDDSRPDILNLRLVNADGFGFAWATTDIEGIIQRLDLSPGPDFEGTGAGTVKLYFLASCVEVITGVSVGMHIDNLPNNVDASNGLTIQKSVNCCKQEQKNCRDKVLMCVKNESTCIPQKRVNQLLQQGATLGGCIRCNLGQTASRSTEELTVYPNPGNNRFIIKTSLEGPVKLELRSMMGDIIYARHYNIIYDQEIVFLPDRKIKPGSYFLSISNDKARLGKTLIIRD